MPIEQQTLEIVRGLLTELRSHQAGQTISLHSSFDRDLGLGSLERVELLIRCEARFNARLPDETAQRADTPAELIQALHEAGAGRTTRPRFRIQPPSREAAAPPPSATTWVEVLRWHAETEPDRVQVHLLETDSRQDITYAQLLEKSSEVAAGLVAAGLRRNETVAIMLPTCADFFYAFYGVMLAGGIAVPIYPPARPDQIEEYVRRQVAILRDGEVRFLICFDRVKALSQIMRLSIPRLAAVSTVDDLCEAGARPRLTQRIDAQDVAFIQYTSGSTGNPKGVVLSHSNILANVQGIGWAVKVRPTDVAVSWLPLYHDMGLIGSWLFSVYYAVPIVMFSPLAFLSRPERWLWALHDSRGTLCPAPNFAYELCARKIPDKALEGLDLSRWRVAINAGEAVLAETLTRFAERFQPYGFRPESFLPCYGLAESSVALTFPPLNRRPVIDTIGRDLFEREGKAVPAELAEPNVLRFVANGGPMPGHEVRLVDDQGQVLGERLQGRLFFRGPSMTSGYYQNPEATAALLTEDGWMDSGDLAYWADGELFITGRYKDCIIKSGRNIIPHEVEVAAAEVPGVRKGCVAAFGAVDTETGTERLVVVAETRATRGAELRRIKVEIIQSTHAVLSIPPDKVVLVPPHTIPKTSSGKIRRNETRSLFVTGNLGTGKRPPWVQVCRLGLSNLGAWVSIGLKRRNEWLRRVYTSALFFMVAGLTGLFARLPPSRKVAARIIRAAARMLLSLTGESVSVNGNDLDGCNGPVVFVANRLGSLDPLVLTAAIPAPFLFADASALASLPSQAEFMLRPLVVPPVEGEVAPPGGTPRQRIRKCLEDGYSVLVLPDGPPGAPAHLSRFRLDAIHAAVATSIPMRPVGVRESPDCPPPGAAQLRRNGARIVIGDPIFPQTSKHRELAELRTRVREAIAKLCL